MKVLLLLALLGFLLYLFWRRFSVPVEQASLTKVRRANNFLPIVCSPAAISKATRNTLWTVASGLILLIIILVVGIKVKIIWLMLPLSLYLIGQLLVYTNHVRKAKDQRIFYDPQTSEVLVDFLKQDTVTFNLRTDVYGIKEIKSVQKNRGTLFGYYRLDTGKEKIMIPYLVEQSESSANQHFFKTLHTFKREVETKLFPIIP